MNLDENGNPIVDEENPEPEIEETPDGEEPGDEGEGDDGEEETDEDGNPIVAETPAEAPAAEPVAEPEAPAPVALEPVAYRAPEAPAEYRHNNVTYAVSESGDTLHHPAYEDPRSEAAEELVEKMLDSGMSEEDAAASYARQVQEYQAAKARYEDQHLYKVEKALRETGPQSFASQVARVHANVRTEMLAGLDDDAANGIIGTFHGKAIALVTQERQAAIDRLVEEQGMNPRAAALKVDDAFMRTPTLYEHALGMAAIGDLKGLVDMIERGVYKKLGQAHPSESKPAAKTGAPPPAAPVKPAATRPAPPPGVGGGAAPARAPGAESTIVPTRDEIAYAKSMGIDAKKYAAALRGG